MDFGIMFYLLCILLFIFVCLTGVLIGVKLDRKYGPNNVLPECVGAIQIYVQDGEAYLFLDTDLTPLEMANHSEIILKVVTQDPQTPL